MPEQTRSAERPSEPQANGLTNLLGDFGFVKYKGAQTPLLAE
jgi:hypothetical protein